MIAAEIVRLAILGHRITVGLDAVELLVRAGYHRMLGARPMRAAVERQIQDAVARALLGGDGTSGRLSVDDRLSGLVIQR